MDNNTANEIAAHLVALRALLERAAAEADARPFASCHLAKDTAKSMGNQLKGLAQATPQLARALGGADAADGVVSALRAAFPTV